MASSSSNRRKYTRPGIIVVGNKIDLEDKREVTTKEGEGLAQMWDCGFIETSAMQATFVDQSFCELIRQCRRAGPVDGLPPQLLGHPLHKASNGSMNGQLSTSTGQNPLSHSVVSAASPTNTTIRLRRRRKRLDFCIITWHYSHLLLIFRMFYLSNTKLFLSETWDKNVTNERCASHIL